MVVLKNRYFSYELELFLIDSLSSPCFSHNGFLKESMLFIMFKEINVVSIDSLRYMHFAYDYKSELSLPVQAITEFSFLMFPRPSARPSARPLSLQVQAISTSPSYYYKSKLLLRVQAITQSSFYMFPRPPSGPPARPPTRRPTRPTINMNQE